MKIRRKATSCLNCGSTLDKVYNYCPNCGQENNHSDVSFNTLLGDFFNTYLAIDSRFGRSVKPFLFKPGWLTNRFIEGKRVSYAHPVRLYLIISIFYFFVINLAVVKQVQKKDEGIVRFEDKGSKSDLDSLSNEEKEKLALATIDSTFSKIPEDILSTNEKIELRDSLILATTKMDSADNNDDFILSRVDWDKIEEYKYNTKYTNEQLYDSVKIEGVSPFEELMVKQAIRVNRADKEQVAGFVFKNLPLMMLLLIPIFALILKVLYIRKKELLYIRHIIHALHLHTFAYFLYGICIVLMIYLLDDENTRGILGGIGFILVTVYALLSFKRVYHQNWLKTTIKFLMTGSIYALLIFIFFLVEMVISLLLF